MLYKSFERKLNKRNCIVNWIPFRYFTACAALAAIVFLPFTAASQPSLTINRIVNLWPEIDVYFTASCSGQPEFNLQTQNFSIAENGVPVTNFTLWCPDPNTRCRFDLN